MDLNKRIKELEDEVVRLKDRERHFEHDIEIFRQVFQTIKGQFEQMKKELGRR